MSGGQGRQKAQNSQDTDNKRVTMDIINIFCNIIFNIILSFFFLPARGRRARHQRLGGVGVKLRDLRGPRP